MNVDRWSPVILTLVTLIPLAGALLLLLLPRRDRDLRVFALVISLLTFVLSLHLPVHFHRVQAGFQYELDKAWIPTPNIHYHMGIDGISVWLVVRPSRQECRRSATAPEPARANRGRQRFRSENLPLAKRESYRPVHRREENQFRWRF